MKRSHTVFVLKDKGNPSCIAEGLSSHFLPKAVLEACGMPSGRAAKGKDKGILGGADRDRKQEAEWAPLVTPVSVEPKCAVT